VAAGALHEFLHNSKMTSPSPYTYASRSPPDDASGDPFRFHHPPPETPPPPAPSSASKHVSFSVAHGSSHPASASATATATAEATVEALRFEVESLRRQVAAGRKERDFVVTRCEQELNVRDTPALVADPVEHSVWGKGEPVMPRGTGGVYAPEG